MLLINFILISSIGQVQLTDLESKAVNQANVIRRRYNLTEFVVDQRLQNAARNQANQAAVNPTWGAHYGFPGWVRNAGFEYENLNAKSGFGNVSQGTGQGPMTPELACDMMLWDAGHMRDMTDPCYNRVGIAFANNTNSFNNIGGYYVVIDYGASTKPPSVPIIVPPTPPPVIELSDFELKAFNEVNRLRVAANLIEFKMEKNLLELARNPSQSNPEWQVTTLLSHDVVIPEIGVWAFSKDPAFLDPKNIYIGLSGSYRTTLVVQLGRPK